MADLIRNYINIINDLHAYWEPHDEQITVGKALFNDDVRHMFVQCGRKWGKSELAIYMLWRWCLTFQNASCYYISPFAKQSKEIIWANKRLQNFGSRNYITSVNNSELRINFTNGSFIKCDGSDNFEAYRGITPHLVLYDEFKDFRPEFHISMAPNLSVHNAPLIIIGTPPDYENQYVQLAEEYKLDPKKRFFQFSSFGNPHIDREWLENEKKTLYARGEGDVWEREYMGRFVTGGINSIFPMLSKRYIYKHDDVIRGIDRDKKKLSWFCVCDPGTTTCFAVLFGCINPYTQQIYLLDEIYETDQKKTSVNVIGQTIKQMKNELYARGDWTQCADEAAAWFIAEMADRFDEGFLPTQKSLNKKDEGLGLIKDIMLQDKLIISDRCKKLYWEMENYVRDKFNRIPKVNDHLIDCFRYLLDIAGYSLNTRLEPRDYEEIHKETKRFYTLTEDLLNDGLIEDDL